MSDKIKNIVITIIFPFILIIFLFLNIIIPDNEISKYERRKLTKLPNITYNNVISGNFSNKFDSYTLDQFPFRDSFREFKNKFEFNILNKNDINNTFIYDGGIYKLNYNLNEKSINYAVSKINYIKNNYLDNNNIYFTIIPDKNYYLDDDILKLDYEKLEDLMINNLDIAYINIFDKLSLDDYYKTDLHWKAESLENVSNYIMKSMKNEIKHTYYYQKEVGDFYGAYYGNLITDIKPDSLVYLTNNNIDNLYTYNYENNSYKKIYDLEKIDSADKYDIFLSGPTPIIEINSYNNSTNKELIIFRDSFASSITPLFVAYYDKITLIDIRYINSSILDNYITFSNQDILFMYSIDILNNSFSLK